MCALGAGGTGFGRLDVDRLDVLLMPLLRSTSKTCDLPLPAGVGLVVAGVSMVRYKGCCAMRRTTCSIRPFLLCVIVYRGRER